MTPAFSGRATTVFSRPPTARTGLSITPRRPRNILIADAPHACSRSPGMPMARPISAGRCRCRQFWMSRRTRWKRIRRLANKPGAGKQFELVSGRPVASSPANCGTVRQPASVPKYHLHGRFDFGRPSRNLLPQPSQIKIMIHKTNLPLRAAMLCAALLLNAGSVNLRAETFRPPSVPLVACDPYFSLWSPADKLTDADTTHWTGKARQLTGLVKIDGKNFRVMGAEPTDVPVLPQTSLEVLPTRTIYSFEGEGVRLTLTFMTAALPDDLDLLSRPVTYLTWESRPTDNKNHKVSVYFDVSAAIACNTPDQAVNFQKADSAKIKAWRVGTVEQPVLQKRGDDLRIDWGCCYLALVGNAKGSQTANTSEATRAD